VNTDFTPCGHFRRSCQWPITNSSDWE
jgi:hypothetical protein